ncbi:MBL fold metallo-hydrolase [Acinetobacter sp.]|uniref:MBL fold metallo-hydrolase n=1 Tax=Acinetobacter sp. TaxID=472 RepID=UPI00388D307B
MDSIKQQDQDEYFVVHQIKDYLYAIEEPSYYQGNFSYLLIGTEQALMFDAGASHQHDMTQVIKRLTDKPFAVIPSHLHFDHIGGLKFFDQIYLPDLACLICFKDDAGLYQIPDEFHLGSIDGFQPAPIQITRLLSVGDVIDLGGISFKLLHAPGHSQDSIILYSERLNICLLGDVLYPSELYVGNISDYEKSLVYIQTLTNSETLFFGAHPFVTSHIPQIRMAELELTLQVMQAIVRGEAEVRKVEPSILVREGKRHCVDERICIYTDIIFKSGLTIQYS